MSEWYAKVTIQLNTGTTTSKHQGVILMSEVKVVIYDNIRAMVKETKFFVSAKAASDFIARYNRESDLHLRASVVSVVAL